MVATPDPTPALLSLDDLLRRRLMVVSIVAFVAQITGMIVIRSTSEAVSDTTPIGPIMTCLGCVLGGLSAYYRWHVRLVARIMMTFCGMSVMFGIATQGGLISYSSAAIFVLPAVCAFLLGSKDTAYFAALVIGGLIVLYLIDDMLTPLAMSAQTNLNATFTALVVVASLIFSSLFFLVREIELTDARLRATLRKHEYLATHDTLTGLPNRAAMNAFIDRIGAEKARHIFYLIDLDGFKPVNDAFGHAAGDALLQRVAKALRQVCPEAAQIARLGGDEFFVGLPLLSADDTEEFGHDLVHALTLEHGSGDIKKPVTASVGSAIYPDTSVHTDTVLSKADQALYAAKAGGRGIYVAHNDLTEYGEEVMSACAG